MQDLGDGAPLWRQIQKGIEGDIGSGVLRAGARLPSEAELASRYGAHRHTVRRAMLELAQRGVVRIEQGRGTFVHEHTLDYVIGRRTRVEENLVRAHRSLAGQLLSAQLQDPSPEEKQALKLRARSKVVVAETLNESDGYPLSVVRHVLEASRFGGFAAAYEASGGSVTAALSACGVEDFTRAFTRISARLPTNAEAKWLRQPRVLPVLVTESLEVDPDGRPVKYGLARFAADRVNLILDTQGTTS